MFKTFAPIKHDFLLFFFFFGFVFVFINLLDNQPNSPLMIREKLEKKSPLDEVERKRIQKVRF